MAKRISQCIWGKMVHVLVLGTFTILLAFPFYWMLITSFKQNLGLYTMENNPFIFNAKPSLRPVKFLCIEHIRLRWLATTSSVLRSALPPPFLLPSPTPYTPSTLAAPSPD